MMSHDRKALFRVVSMIFKIISLKKREMRGVKLLAFGSFNNNIFK